MSDPAPSAKPDSLLARLKGLFSSERDASLRESLEGVIANHDAQNPVDGLRAEARSMMLNLIKFADLRVDDVMVPRADIVAIESTQSIRELLERFIDANHSRMPVYRESLDDLSGMIHIKDLVRWLAEKGNKSRRKKSVKETALSALSLNATDLATEVGAIGIAREVLFVPPSMPAADLLIKMQSTHIHMAIVVDEYGGTDGLVSIEDLVEQIVGDISDEHDSDEELIMRNGDGTFTANARAGLDELEKLLNVDFLPEERDEETDTLGGLIFSMFGRVPVRGELLRHASGVEFEILEADPRRVKRVRIRPPEPYEPAVQAEALSDGEKPA
jgi:CBS domain containing-hemolysin-like protein